MQEKCSEQIQTTEKMNVIIKFPQKNDNDKDSDIRDLQDVKRILSIMLQNYITEIV